MPDGIERHHVETAVDLILRRGLIGMAWLDDELVVRRRRGKAAAWIGVGLPLVQALPMLVGYEQRLDALRAAPDENLVLTNVGFHAAAGAPAKFDMQVYRLAEEAEFLVVVSQESTQSVLALELHREASRRQLAESREAELARTLQRTNAELSRANRDLEEFAYVISHDLRAPLRALRQSADLVEHEMTADPGEQARERLAAIRILSRRMAAMMSGLLEYSRIGRKAEAIAEIDTERLVRDVIRGVGAPSELHIEVAGDWPTLATLGDPLDIVLRNLLENAVKHHDTKAGTIMLTATDDGHDVVFEVADDGPGIAPAYHQAIFEPFRSARQEMPPESSGIGLALVKKTAEVVGGRIDVISDPAHRRGTTFRLRWPKTIVTG